MPQRQEHAHCAPRGVGMRKKSCLTPSTVVEVVACHHGSEVKQSLDSQTLSQRSVLQCRSNTLVGCRPAHMFVPITCMVRTLKQWYCMIWQWHLQLHDFTMVVMVEFFEYAGYNRVQAQLHITVTERINLDDQLVSSASCHRCHVLGSSVKVVCDTPRIFQTPIRGVCKRLKSLIRQAGYLHQIFLS